MSIITRWLPKDLGFFLVGIARDDSRYKATRIVAGIALWLLNVGLVVFNILPQTLSGGHPQETISSRTGKALLLMKLEEFANGHFYHHAESRTEAWQVLVRYATAYPQDVQDQIARFRQFGESIVPRPLHGWERAVALLLGKVIGRAHFYRKVSLREGMFSDRDRSL